MLVAGTSFLSPLFFTSELGANTAEAIFSADGWLVPLKRSFVLALASTALATTGGVLIAFLVRGGSLDLIRLLPALLLPMMAGASISAFSLKMGFLASPLVRGWVSERQPLPTWLLLVAAESWPLLLASIYLLSERSRLIAPNRLELGRQLRLTPGEQFRDIFWPGVRGLASVLALFGSAIAFFEYSRPTLILRTSSGTGTEFASQWLLRHFNSLLMASPWVATRSSMGLTIVGLFLAIGSCVACAWVSIRIVDLVARLVGGCNWPRKIPGRMGDLASVLSLGAALLPFGLPLAFLGAAPRFPVGELLRSVTLSSMAAVLAAAGGVLIAIAGRLLLPDTLASFDQKSARLFALVLSLQMLPAIGLALLGYWWMTLLVTRETAEWAAPLIWVATQTLLALPIAVVFSAALHFRVTGDEITVHEASKVDVGSMLLGCFVSRFRVDYGLVFVFCFSTVWLESTVSSVLSTLSPFVPSIAHMLARRMDGRGAAYQEATGLILAALVPIILFLVVQQRGRNGVRGEARHVVRSM